MNLPIRYVFLAACLILVPWLLAPVSQWLWEWEVWTAASFAEKPIAPGSVLPDSASVFAWILCGSRDWRSVNETRLAARRLIHVGVRPERIFVASDGDSPDDAIPRWNVGFAADEQTIATQLRQLRDAMQRRGTLVVFATGHGGPGEEPLTENTLLSLHRGHIMSAVEMKSLLGSLPSLRRLILVIDVCYGGGFVKILDTLPVRYVGMSPTDEKRPTVPDAFTRAFWAEIARVDRDSAFVSSFDDAVLGCREYRAHLSCVHGDYGCASFAYRSTLRRREPWGAHGEQGWPALGEVVDYDVLPEPIQRVPAAYPPAARRAHLEGTVTVFALVDRDGGVRDAIVQSYSPLLDKAALAAVRQWRFRPAQLENQPIPMWVRVPISFSSHRPAT